MELFKQLFGGSSKSLMEIWDQGAVVLDVRTKEEFQAGHAPGAINIPLNSVDQSLDEISGWEKPIIACCASGRRSGIATQRLKSKGIDIYNGGSWKQVADMITNQQRHE